MFEFFGRNALRELLIKIKSLKVSTFENDAGYITSEDIPNNVGKIFYCTCSTEAATAAKVISCSDTSFVMEVGTIIAVKFTATNTASNCTLNVNNKGAKQIYYNNAVYTAASNQICGYANRVNFYMYDGTYWVWVNSGIDTNTTYSAVTQSANGLMTAADKKRMDSEGKWLSCSTARNVAAKVVTCDGFVLQAGSRVYIKFTNTGTANPTSGNITLNVNNTGAKNVWVARANAAPFQCTYSHGTYFYNGAIGEFVYDGTSWLLYIGIDTNTTYSAVTQSANGLMTAADKKKLDNMDTITEAEIDALFNE